MRAILGVDSGGTKCDAILVRDDGVILGWGRSAPVEIRRGSFPKGVGRSNEAIGEAVHKALGKTMCEELHFTSLSGVPFGFLKEGMSVRVQLHPASEKTSAFMVAGETSGIVALAGTGAFVHGVTRDGRELHMDGLGPQLGDHGGGYQIGLQGIRAAAQSGWHPRHKTSLAKAVYKACGVKEGDPAGISLWNFLGVNRDRSEVASISRAVDAEARSGDEVAIRILQAAAADIAETVRDVVSRLQMDKDDYALIGVGGVITRSDIYWTHLCEQVRVFAPNLRPVRPDLPPVIGLVLSVMKRIPGIDIETASRTLLQTARATIGTAS